MQFIALGAREFLHAIQLTKVSNEVVSWGRIPIDDSIHRTCNFGNVYCIDNLLDINQRPEERKQMKTPSNF